MTRQTGIGDLLDQDKIWISREEDGLRELKIADMHLNHLLNLRRWLTSQAQRLQSSEILALYSMASMVSGEAASADLDMSINAAEGEPPLAWLQGKPLYRALGREIFRRQGGSAEPSLRRRLSKAERVELAHHLRPIDNTIQDAIRALSPIEGMHTMSVAAWNAQVESLIASVSRLRRA